METVLITKTGRGNTHIKSYPEIHKIYIEIQQLFGDQNIADDIYKYRRNAEKHKKLCFAHIEEKHESQNHTKDRCIDYTCEFNYILLIHIPIPRLHYNRRLILYSRFFIKEKPSI